MVGSAEWVQNNKKPISCPFGNKEPEKYGFDITKADKVFDLLLSEGQIKLKPYHKIPTDHELKNIKYSKWHNATSHDTNECKVFCQQIQSAIEQGRLKFEAPKKPMNIDGHPFPTNMVDVGRKRYALQTKVLTSQSAKESGLLIPKFKYRPMKPRARSHRKNLVTPQVSVHLNTYHCSQIKLKRRMWEINSKRKGQIKVKLHKRN